MSKIKVLNRQSLGRSGFQTESIRFVVVDIYLEGLRPRVDRQWEAIKKKPKKRETKTIDVNELESSLARAAKDREKWEKEQKKDASEKLEIGIEDKATKLVKPLTFDNGLMVSSLNELKDILPSLDNSVFNTHVNDSRNDIADWVGKEVDHGFGEKLKGAANKAEVIKMIDGFMKSERDKISNEKKESGKKDEDK